MHNKKGLKTFVKLISPSLLELISILTVFIILLIANQIHQQYSADLTNLSAATFKGTFLNGFAHWFSTLYTSKGFSVVAIYIFWLFIALLVYVLAFRLNKNAEEIVDDISIRHYMWPRGANRNKPIEEYIEKFSMKLITLIVLCLYVIKLSPLLVNWWKLHYIFVSISLHTLTIYAILLLFLTLYIHGLIILIRILILRQRIVGI